MAFTCCNCKKTIEYNSPTVGSYNVGEARDATGAMPIMVSIPDCLTLWACKDCKKEIIALADKLADMTGNLSCSLGSLCTPGRFHTWINKVS
jgi:hypothetical protein